MRKVILALVSVGLMSGVAAADRHHGGWSGGGRVTAHDNHNNHGSWSGGVRVTPHRNFVENRNYHRSWNRGGSYVRVARRPIYVQRPVIRHRYFNYYQRPAIIVENYNPMEGYIWVPGQWQWSGYEWIWQPGHYEVDANYNYGYYDGY